MSELENVSPEPAVEPTEPETESETPKVDAPVEKRKYKVKIDNEESEVDEDELISNYQLKKASHQKFQQASALQKELEDFLYSSKANPKQIFEMLGINAKDFSEQLLIEELMEASLSPTEREAKELKAKLAKYEAAEKESEAQAQARKYTLELSEAESAVEAEVVQALQEAGLKPTPRNIARLAEQMLASERSAVEASRYVKRDLDEDLGDLLSTHSIEDLMKIPAAKKLLEALKSQEISQLQAKRTVSAPKEASTQKETPQFTRIDDFFGKRRNK